MYFKPSFRSNDSSSPSLQNDAIQSIPAHECLDLRRRVWNLVTTLYINILYLFRLFEWELRFSGCKYWNVVLSLVDVKKRYHAAKYRWPAVVSYLLLKTTWIRNKKTMKGRCCGVVNWWFNILCHLKLLVQDYTEIANTRFYDFSRTMLILR